jgi:hypothetical protein
MTGRDDQAVDAGDFLLGVDEEPFPVEGNDFDFQRLGLAGKWLCWIELMGADPGDAAEEQHYERRH